MSDSAQGPGWWLASDGKWYPPQSSPPPFPPPPPSSDHQFGPNWWLASDGRWYPPAGAPYAPVSSPPASPQRTEVSRGLAGTLQGFLWAVGGLSIVAVLSSLVGFVTFNQYWSARAGSIDEARAADNLEAADNTINAVVGLTSIGALVIFILIVIWTHQAHKATQALSPGERSWSSGWTVGAWFIPLANAIIPKIILNEIERIALAPRTAGVVHTGWQTRPTMWIGWVWWVLFVIGAFVGSIGNSLYNDLGGSAGSWRVGYWLVAVGYAAVAASSCLGALYIRRISQALSSS